MQFSSRLPTEEEAVEFAAEALNLSPDTFHSWKKDMETTELAFLKSLTKSLCTRCEKTWPIHFCLSKHQNSMLLNCMNYWKHPLKSFNAPQLYSRVIHSGSNAMEMMLAWHSMNVKAAATLDRGYYCL
eukprot:IDg17452t1